MHVNELRWQNFRAFRDTGWLELRPLTLIIGPNNSGKSSILAPLLVLRQTLRSGRGRSPLVIRGGLINAGSFSDLVHGHNPSGSVTFGFRFPPRGSQPKQRDLGRNAPAICEVTFAAGTSPGIVNLERYTVEDSFNRALLTRTRKAKGYSLEKIRTWAIDSKDNSVSGRDESDKAARRAIRDSSPYHFLFESDRILDTALEALALSSRRPAGGGEQTESIRDIEPLHLSSYVTKYCSVVDLVQHFVQTFLRNVVYLGPTREQPKRLYQVSGDAPRDVGIRGEFGPEMMLRAAKADLFTDVNRWLQHFGMPGRLDCDRLTETAFSLVLKGDPATGAADSDAAKTNFADMGFGFSQILPLIVEGLAADDDTLLITEQPEIHLNPRLQSLLGDFFAEVTGRGVSVLAETHSEHLLLSVRRLIAEGRLDADRVAIYYVERQNSFSQVRAVQIQPNGHIENEDWPKGFFEDSLRESFALATAQARSKRAD